MSEAVLQLGECTLWSGFYSLCEQLGFPPKRSVCWDEEQRKMVRQAQMWEGDCSISMLYVRIDTVQCVVSSGGAPYILYKSDCL